MMETEDGNGRFFDRLDVEAAIDNCNFNKAMGTDWFSGKVIKKNATIRQKVVAIVLKWLNEAKIPNYVMDGKAVLFSKTGKEMAEMSDTRLITVRTHLLKILEKTIMYKLLGENSDLIKVGGY